MGTASASPSATSATLAAVHGPTPGNASRRCALRAARMNTSARRRSMPNRWNAQYGVPASTAADGATRRFAGPGATVPSSYTSFLYDSWAASVATFWPITVGRSTSKTARVFGILRPGWRRFASASADSCGWKPESSSSSPHSAGAFSAAHAAPAPHASTSTTPSNITWCTVAGPCGVWVARQTSPPRKRIDGPDPMGPRVRARLRGLCGRNRDRTSGAASSVGIQRDLQRECAALSGFGFDSEISIMHAGDLSRKPQAEACARGVRSRSGLDATEAREQLALVFHARRLDHLPEQPIHLVGFRDEKRHHGGRFRWYVAKRSRRDHREVAFDD